MIVILWLVHANLWVTSAAPSVNNVEVGRNVTLVPQYSRDPSEINWKIDDPAVTAIYNRPGSPSTKTNDQPKAEEGQSGLSASHMTAIVIGGIALVVVAIVGTVIYKKCRRRRSAPNVIIIQKRSDGTAYVRSGEKEKTAMFTKTPGGS